LRKLALDTAEVTARIVARQVSDLVELTIEGGETLTGTPQHPIWSIERKDWVELGDLEIGEHLWTEDGPVELQSTRLLSTAESVYNLEVHGNHIYQVGELGVLVHNAKVCKVKPGDKGSYGDLRKKKRENGETEKLDIDHRPSFAAQRKAKETLLRRRLTKKEVAKLKKSTPSVATPRKQHQLKSRTYGGRNSPAQIRADAKDLAKARAKDNRAMR